MPGENQEEVPGSPVQPDTQLVLDALKEAKAEAAEARAETQDLSKKFEGLLLDSNSKYKLLEKEVQALREQAASHEGDSDTLSYVAHQAEVNPFPRRPKNTGLKVTVR
jgi:hypothetical protein